MFVESEPGTYQLTEDSVGTRFTHINIRTFYNAGNPDDLAKATPHRTKLMLAVAAEAPSTHRTGKATTWLSLAAALCSPGPTLAESTEQVQLTWTPMEELVLLTYQ